jgi:2-dehydropantoate 2-reductase
LTRIAIVGPGAIGGVVAAWLAQNDAFEVSVCARTHFDGLEVQTPDGVLVAAPPVYTQPDEAAPVDWALICAKTYDAEGAAAWLPALLGPETCIGVLQNGVEHVERFAPHAGSAPIVPCVVDIPAERSAPGRVLQRRFGTILAPDDENGRALAELFAQTRIEASTTPDWRSAAWAKLCINCAGAVSAVTLQGAGVARREPIADLMRALVRECAAVGHAEGAVLGDDTPDHVVAGYQAADPASMNSLHADRLNGRRMEIDARNGVIVRKGAQHGIEAPMNALMVALLEASGS